MENVREYKCPSCGAPLTFDAGSQNLLCNSCGTSFDTETLINLSEAENAQSVQSKFDWEEYEPRDYTEEETVNLSEYNCTSCGAQITGEDTLGATTCPYCGNSTIVKKQFEGNLRPDLLIPFKLDKKAAAEAFEQAAAKIPFLPKLFRSTRKVEELIGLYIPFWLFDCDCDASVRYRAEIVTRWRDSNYEYTKTDYFRIFRDGSIGFSKIPVDGSQKADNDYMEAIEPFDYKDAVNFNAAYLSGFLADKYDVSAEESEPRANERVKNSTVSAFRETVRGYTLVTSESADVSFANGKKRYSLLPVWMLNIKYKDKNYHYAINGQTGKVAGAYPVDKLKKWLYFAMVFGISYLIGFAVAKLLGLI